MKRILIAAAGVIALGLAAPVSATDAPPASKNKIELENAWMNEAVAGEPAAAYVTIENKSGKADRLLFVTGPTVNHVDIDKVDDSAGSAKSTALEVLDVPAGGKIRLDADKMHLTVFGLQQALTRGQTLFLIFHFEKSGDVAIHFLVKRPEPAPSDGPVDTRGA
jgi:copper(I)-binding protein